MRCKLFNLLSSAAGAEGMVGGQMLDIEGEAKSLSLIGNWKPFHMNKTGALLSFCIEAGAILAELHQEKRIQIKSNLHGILD